MILALFGFLVGISLTLIILGLFRPNESGFALIGFALLFILSILLNGGNVEIETGSNITSTYSYDGGGNINGTAQSIIYDYEYWDDETSHQFGFWLAIVSAIGFIFMLFAINRGPKDD